MIQINYLTILLSLCCTTLLACGGNKEEQDNTSAEQGKVESVAKGDNSATAKRYDYRIEYAVRASGFVKSKAQQGYQSCACT